MHTLFAVFGVHSEVDAAAWRQIILVKCEEVQAMLDCVCVC